MTNILRFLSCNYYLIYYLLVFKFLRNSLFTKEEIKRHALRSEHRVKETDNQARVCFLVLPTLHKGHMVPAVRCAETVQ